MQEESVAGKYEKAFEQMAALHPIFPTMAREQMAQMVDAIMRSNKNIVSRLSTNQTFQQKGGFIAEEIFTETFNLDAILNDSDVRALTDHYPEWKGYGLKGNDNPDIAIVKDGEVIKTVQSKFEQTAKKNSGKLSKINKDGNPKYGDVDDFLGPSDQVDAIATHAKDYADNTDNPNLARSHRQTEKKIQKTLTDGESSSVEMTKAEADQMGKGDLTKLQHDEGKFQTRSTVKQMRNAAVGAAAMSAIVSGSINTVRYIQLAREGKLTAEEATVKIVGETIAAAADSALKASANVGVQSLLVRYGSQKAVTEALVKQGFRSMLKSNAVTVGVVCAVDAVKDLVVLGMGKMTKEEFFERQGKGLLMTSAGVAGGSLGLAGANAAAGLLGIGAQGVAMGALGIVGGLSGGMIAGLAMTLAIENGIEAPYRDLVQHTSNLHAAARELERVSQTVFMSQVLFSKYLEADADLEQRLQTQFSRIDAAGDDARNAIMKV